MNRNIKTVLLAIIVVGGLWVLTNQEQIERAGGLSTYFSQSANRSPVSAARGNRNRSWQTNSAAPTRTASAFRDNRSAQPFRTTALRSSATSRPFQLARSTEQRSYLLANTGLPERNANTIRIASFKMNADSKMDALAGSLNLMSHLCSQFDIIAFQEINRQNATWLETLGQNVATQSGGNIQFRAISDRGRTAPGDPQFVILYNARSLELDFAHWYSVNDPDGLLTREPLVGWFRTRNVPSDEAFTFTLANIQLDNHRPDLELAYLGELFRAIRQDGRGEDDVIITGNFHAGDRGLSALRKRAGLTWVVYDMATTIDKGSQFDNLVFAQNATVEFTGRGGVFDFLAAYNLPLDRARSISTHMPVWAEFSITEGGSKNASPSGSN